MSMSDNELRRTILANIDRFEGGCYIHSPAGLIKSGFPADFINGLVLTHLDDPDDPRGSVRSARTLKRVEHLRGVHDLDMLQGLAEMVGADAYAGSQFSGRGRRARAIADAIRARLTQEAST
jgi:hypothetical protein